MDLHRHLSAVLIVLIATVSGCIAPDGPVTEDAPPEATTGDLTVERDLFEGRIVCGVGAPVGTANPCLFVAGSENVFQFSVSKDLKTLFVALTWKPSSPIGDELELLVESKGANVFGTNGYRYGSASGSPDLVLRVDDAEITERDHSWENITSSLPLQARVFPARTVPPSVVLVQDFTVHVIAYYGEQAPADADPLRERDDDAGRIPAGTDASALFLGH